eukprot:g62714.t1
MSLWAVVSATAPETAQELAVALDEVVTVLQTTSQWSLCQRQTPLPDSTNLGWVPSACLRAIDVPKLTRKKLPVVREIYETEKRYVHTLTTVVDLYVTPCREAARSQKTRILTKKQLHILVRNLEDLLAVHFPFLQALKTQLTGGWSTEPERAAISPPFAQHVPHFHVYGEYVNTYEAATQLVQELLHEPEHARFQQLEREARNHPATLGQGIESMLISPVQRIPRYRLLLQEVLKQTYMGHPDYQGVLESLSLVKQLAKRINEDLRASDNRLQIMQLEKQFIGYGPEADGKIPLMTPGRVFIRQGMLWRVARPRDVQVQVFLFNNLLVLGLKKGWQMRVIKELIIDKRFSCLDLEDRKKKYPFQLKQQATGATLTLYAREEQDKTSWLQTFTSVVQAAKESTEMVFQNIQLAHMCKECKKKFGMLLHKHHCHACGYVVCGPCSNARIKLPQTRGMSVRACTSCMREQLTKPDQIHNRRGRLGKSNNASATMLTATNSSVSMVKPPAEDSATAAGVRVGRPSDAPPAVPAHLLAEAAAAAKLASQEQPATDDASAAATATTLPPETAATTESIQTETIATPPSSSSVTAAATIATTSTGSLSATEVPVTTTAAASTTAAAAEPSSDAPARTLDTQATDATRTAAETIETAASAADTTTRSSEGVAVDKAGDALAPQAAAAPELALAASIAQTEGRTALEDGSVRAPLASPPAALEAVLQALDGRAVQEAKEEAEKDKKIAALFSQVHEVSDDEDEYEQQEPKKKATAAMDSDEEDEHDESCGMARLLGLAPLAVAGSQGSRATDLRSRGAGAGKIKWWWAPKVDDKDDKSLVPAQIVAVAADGARTLRSLEGELLTVPADSPLLQANECAVAGKWEDLLYLDVEEKELEPAILHQLRTRYQQDQVYTALGSILVAVNPFKVLPIYTRAWEERFQTTPDDRLHSQPPHVFGLAAQARASLEAAKPQCIIIGGESGSGKTESTKLILQYLSSDDARRQALAHPSRAPLAPAAEAAEGGESKAAAAKITTAIMQSNPLLEAFGNASTVHNHNSSRFGKWIQIDYSKDQAGAACIVGGRVETYLLERTRVARHAPGERTFHICYQVCALLDAAAGPQRDKNAWLREWEAELKVIGECGLAPRTIYNYLGTAPAAADLPAAAATLHALGVLGFSWQQTHNILRCIAAVLLLGNVQQGLGAEASASPAANTATSSSPTTTSAAHSPSPSSSSTKNVASPRLGENLGAAATSPVQLSAGEVAAAASALKLSTEALGKALRFKTVKIVLENHQAPLTPQQAVAVRDALAKALYGSLFDWLVDQVNRSLLVQQPGAGGDAQNTLSISVLDIFGFEICPHNSLEQFFINYANERLQDFFNMRVFKREVELYQAEGLSIESLVCPSSQRCLDLFEGDGRTHGILKMLDEENAMGTVSWPHLRERLLDVYGAQQVEFERNEKKMAQYRKRGTFNNTFWTSMRDVAGTSFTVRHYSGDVTYHLEEFLSKNSDRLPPALAGLLRSSQDPFIHSLFQTETEANKGATGSYQQIVAMEKRKKQACKQAMDSVGTQFKQQLQKLIKGLGQAEPHFLRCLRPNEQKRPFFFSSHLVWTQINNTGLPAALQIRRAGFPIRLGVVAFCLRYGAVLAACLPRELANSLPKTDLNALAEHTSSSSSSSSSPLPSHRPSSPSPSHSPSHAASASPSSSSFSSFPPELHGWLAALLAALATAIQDGRAAREVVGSGLDPVGGMRLGKSMLFLRHSQHLALDGVLEAKRLATEAKAATHARRFTLARIGALASPNSALQALQAVRRAWDRAEGPESAAHTDSERQPQQQSTDKSSAEAAHSKWLAQLPHALDKCLLLHGQHPLSPLCVPNEPLSQQRMATHTVPLLSSTISDLQQTQHAGDAARVVRELFHNVLDATGLRYHAYPSTCALAALQLARGVPALRDELYAQLLRQNTQAPAGAFSVAGALEALKLLCLALICFPPTSLAVVGCVLDHLATWAAQLPPTHTDARPLQLSSRPLAARAALLYWTARTGEQAAAGAGEQAAAAASTSTPQGWPRCAELPIVLEQIQSLQDGGVLAAPDQLLDHAAHAEQALLEQDLTPEEQAKELSREDLLSPGPAQPRSLHNANREVLCAAASCILSCAQVTTTLLSLFQKAHHHHHRHHHGRCPPHCFSRGGRLQGTRAVCSHCSNRPLYRTAMTLCQSLFI